MTKMTEREKYQLMWTRPEYRQVAPGEYYARLFIEQAKPRPGDQVIDFGCGTGRGGVALASLGRLKVMMLDFAENCLDETVKTILDNGADLHFIQADLEQPIPVVAEHGFCADVMEHIPPDKVDTVLKNIISAAQKVWFSICLCPDSCGVLIGKTLHLSVHPFEWWENKFKELDCKILYSRKEDQAYAHFYVSAWLTGEDVRDNAKLNTDEEIIVGNVKENITRGFMQVTPHVTNELECMILGGGPSLNEYLDEIKRNRADGVKLITLNGSYNWAIAHGLTPSAQIVVDARPFNKRFVEPVLEDTVYLIASQVDPPVLENLPTDRTYLWHTAAEQIKEILDGQYGENKWWPVPGGSTVLLRSFPLLRMLGYHQFILYGCDSCLASDDAHHAYSQPENDAGYKIPVILNPGGRIFFGTLWMISQAYEFIETMRYLGDEIDLDVKGDGLLANILKAGAELADLDVVATMEPKESNLR